MKEFVRLSAHKKFGKFTGHWKKNGNNYDGKFMVYLESNYFDLEDCDIRWGFTINNVSVTHDKVGKDIFVPFNAETTSYVEPYNAFKVKGSFLPFGELKIMATINDETTIEIDFTTEEIIKYGLKSFVVGFDIEDEEPEVPEPVEPEPTEPEIPAPDVDPGVTGFWDALKQVVNEFLNGSKLWFFLGFFVLGFIFHWWLF